MRAFSTDFFINGKPMLAPDADVKLEFTDLDDAASGRDESGLMHRFVARYKVPAWEFSYSLLTEQERLYMEGLFPQAPSFTFTHPAADGKPVDTVCYRSKYGICWRNARTGLWSGYSFSVIGC